MTRTRRTLHFAAGVVLCTMGSQALAQTATNDLIFIIDRSNSIDSEEWDLQLRGVSNSLCGDDKIIPDGSTDEYKVTVITFAGTVVVPVNLDGVLINPGNQQQVCDDIEDLVYSNPGPTLLDPALETAGSRFLANPDAIVRMLVISTDGGIGDVPDATAEAQTLRTLAPGPSVKICTVLVANTCDFPDAGDTDDLKEIANTPPEPNAGETVGVHRCVEPPPDPGSLAEFSMLCTACICNLTTPLVIPPELDCNLNGFPDSCDIIDDHSTDCDGSGIPDECEVADDPATFDCNGNNIHDACEVAGNDCDGNGVPDDCELIGNDCNGNGIYDACDLLATPFGFPETGELVSIQVGLRPRSVIANARDVNGDWVALDVNGDGQVDIATTNSGANTVSVLLNNGVDGNGVWLETRAYDDEPDLDNATVFSLNLPNEPWAITAGDLNLDGLTDLAVVYRSSKVLSVWLNLGFDSCGRWRGYDARLDYFLSPAGCGNACGHFPVSVAIADVGGAAVGFPEVITANVTTQNIAIFENKGNDMNGAWLGLPDGLPNTSDGPLLVDTAGFGPPDSSLPYSHTLEVEDLDGDTDNDIALGGANNGDLIILINSGQVPMIDENLFAAPVTYNTSVGDVTSLTAGYFDDNASLDLAVSVEPAAVEVFLNDGLGVFTLMAASPFLVGEFPFHRPSALASGDLDGANGVDMAIGQTFQQGNESSDAVISILLAQGLDYVEPADDSRIDLPDVAQFDHAASVDIGDIDGNGALDIVATNTEANTIVVLLNELAPAFSEDCNTNQIPDECDSFAGQVVYVDSFHPLPHDGTTWATAYTSLHDGLVAAAASTDPCGVQVWVAEGLYKPYIVPCSGFCPAMQGYSFELRDDVAVYGGFPDDGGDGTFGARNWLLYESILSGDHNGDDRDRRGGTSDNAWHVVTGTDLVARALLDGFTIEAGTATVGEGGGALLIDSAVTIRNCRLTRNTAASRGGAIFVDGGDVKIETCRFDLNWAMQAGGAVCSEGKVTMVSSLLYANHTLGVSSNGGAIAVMGGSADIINCTVAQNDVNSLGDGEGGGLYVTEADVTTSNCIFWGNKSGDPDVELRQIWIEPDGCFAAQYTDIQGLTIYAGAGNIDENPLFVNVPGLDFRIQTGSPVLDAGLNSVIQATGALVDLDNLPRIVDLPPTTGVDMGAYERQSP